MKVLQLIQKRQLRGAEIFACQLSNHLADGGHEILLISLLPGDAPLPYHGKSVQLNRSLHKRFLDYAGWKMLFKEIREFKPDIVQANAGDTLKFAVFSKLLFRWKAPIIFRNANKVSEFINSWPKWIFNKFLFGFVDHVISVSELCRQDFIRTYSFHQEKTTMVPIGIEPHLTIAPLPSDLAPIFSSWKVIVNIASFVPEKNHIGLLRIVRSLIEKETNLQVLLIGDGKLKREIEQQIIDLNLAGNVKLLGFRNDVLPILTHAQAFILPSNIEGLPAVILEAMFCRTPVIAYDTGGIPEVVRNDQTGWLIKSGDENGFTDAIRKVLHSRNLDNIRDNAYKMVVAEYTNKSIVERFLAVYQQVLNNKKRLPETSSDRKN